MTSRPGALAGQERHPGDVQRRRRRITYSYVVTNTGNVTLAGPVTVADDQATVTARRVASRPAPR